MAGKLNLETLSEATKLLREMKSKVTGVNTHILNITKQVKSGEVSTAKGVSFLEAKYQCLLSYLTNLTHLMGVKLRGQSIQDHADVHRMVELRTVLEKMRPIDQKLKYQIDKVIKTATTGISEHDPLRFKPNPANLVSKLDEESEEGSDDEEDKSSKKYRPPRLAAMHYDVEETEKERVEKRLERAKKRALSSSLMRELRQEYDDAPEEIQEGRDLHRLREDRHAKEKTDYEEKYFMRMPVTKKEKQSARKLTTVGSLGQLTQFGDISALTGEDVLDDDDEGRPKKKRKVAQGGKGKGKGKGKKGKKGSKKRFKP